MSGALTRFRGGLERWSLTGLLPAITLLLLTACSRDAAHQVTITDGPTVTRFVVKSAFSEYVELPGLRNELRLTLASYALSCERWVSPGEGDSAVTVTIVTAPTARPAATTYGWVGLAGGALDAPTTEPTALPKALIGKRSRLFEPGGSIRLSHVDIEGHGAIAGALSFEFPGAADRPATRVDGSFEAPLCRISRPSH